MGDVSGSGRLHEKKMSADVLSLSLFLSPPFVSLTNFGVQLSVWHCQQSLSLTHSGIQLFLFLSFSFFSPLSLTHSLWLALACICGSLFSSKAPRAKSE